MPASSRPRLSTPSIPCGQYRYAETTSGAPLAAENCSSAEKTFVVISGEAANPGTRITRAPCACIWASFPTGAFSFTMTVHRMPYRAQYAASEEPVLPDDVARQDVTPPASIPQTCAATKRSLYDPEGLQDSSLKCSDSSPFRGPIRTLRTRGVPPSPKLT